MRSGPKHELGWVAVVCLLLGCSSGADPTGGTPTVVIGPGAGEPIPAGTDGAEGEDTDGAPDPANDGPGLPEGDCNPGSTATCYGGPPGTAGVGVCHAGVATCGPDGQWGGCNGWMSPMPEACNGSDDDCNGVPDDPDQT